MGEQLATVKEVHTEVQFRIRLESVVQLHNERVLDLLHYLTFSLSFDQ